MELVSKCIRHVVACITRVLTATTAGLVLASSVGATGADSSGRDAALDEVEAILREAGATSAELVGYEEDVRHRSADKLKAYAQYLQGLSAEERSHVVENLRYELPYALTADSKPQAGVPQGKIFAFTMEHSAIYPGTTHRITVYVPAQYRGDKPACVYVGLDSLVFETPTVFDNLISKEQMPITIAIGLAPGEIEAVAPPENPRFDRSLEFDALNDHLARFLLEEVFPEVERQRTPDGLPIRLSRDPNDHAAGGLSTGGIAAFTLAWERPDAFRRVFTASGSFVGMRGGDQYPVLVRKTEPKPIRIFMQDGSHDGLDDWIGEVGDWWMENQTLERALEFSGYAVNHVWGEGPHGSRQARAIFPGAMRWLWKDWPKPVTAGLSNNNFLKAILVPGEAWRRIPSEDARPRRLLDESLRFRIVNSLGWEYSAITSDGEVWLKTPHGDRVRLDSGLQAPTGIALSPDERWLAVAESKTHVGYSYRVKLDGTVDGKQPLYWFHVPDAATDSGASAWAFDREGRLYAATRMGVQIFDRNGRSRAILPLPDNNAAVGIAFGDEHFDTLYVSEANHRVYGRKVKVTGFVQGSTPVHLPPNSPG